MSKYLFTVCDTDGEIMAVIMEESFFRRNGGLSDEHVSQKCGGSMPDIWNDEDKDEDDV